METISIRLGNVHIGKRVREDLGNLQELADSIRDVGLLQPIVVNPNKDLIAGQRRLLAVELLGWTHITAVIVNGCDELAKALLAEQQENTCRKDFTPLEAVTMGEKVEAAMKPKAKAAKEASLAKPGNDGIKPQDERQTTGGANLAPPLNPDENAISDDSTNEAETNKNEQENAQDSEEEKPSGRTRTHGAAAAAMSEESYRKAKEIKKAAEADPQRFGDLIEDLKKERSINKAYKELKKRQSAGTVKADSLKDQLGNIVPDHLRDLFGDPCFRKIADAIGQILDSLKDSHNKIKRVGPSYPYMLVSDILKDIATAKTALVGGQASIIAGLPYALCPKCNGVYKGCAACRQSGHVTEWRLREIKDGVA